MDYTVSSHVHTRLATDASSSLDWVTANLSRFAPDLDRVNTTLSTFGEFAILYAYAETWRSRLTKHVPLDRHLPAWRQLIVSQCQAPAYVESARKQVSIAYAFLVPYLVLRATGFRSSAHEHLLRRMQWWGYPAVSETVPYRLLDREFFFWKGGYAREEPNFYQGYRDTTLGQRCSPVHLDLDSAYSVTHTLFYLTDFGSRPLVLPVSEMRYVRGLVNALLVHYGRVGNWDVLGELLMVVPSIGGCNTTVYEWAAGVFAGVRRPDGSVPANGEAATALLDASESTLDELSFRHCYHTTLVALLYYLATLRSGWGAAT
jgi:hypothetical protein